MTVIEVIDTGETDAFGRPIIEETEVPYPAEVRALFSSETVAAAQQVQSRYRVYMPARAEKALQSDGALWWRGKRFEIEGDVEPHVVMGRLHHVEFIAHRVSG
ncbi:hypothetical protein V2J52_13245 [Georgenia sp. MJ173]|uniref:hypothetical protein n=1 Tax=Georgenia sunbinii TaxID=3117728 RepID=UPI002F26C0F5